MSARCSTLALVVALAVVPAHAQEGRTFSPIARPAAQAPLPAGAARISPPRPVSRERIETAVATIAARWNDRNIESLMGPGFTRARELADALQTKVPRDARLRITAIQGWQVIDQYLQAGKIVSRVSVTVRSQVEFNDPASGNQVRDGTNEYVLTLAERAAP